MIISSLLAAVAALTLSNQPVPASADDGPESRAAHYFAPPDSTEAEHVLDTSRLDYAGPITLARAIGLVEEGLGQCVTMRKQMESLIGDTYGSYSVHPDWVDGYQSCLRARHQEIKEIGNAITKRQKDLMDGKDADAALRMSDAMARLTVYRGEVKRAIEAEGKRQKDFVAYYNTGNKPHEDMTPEDKPKAIDLSGQ